MKNIPISNANISKLIKDNLNTVLTTMLLEGLPHGIEFFLVHGSTPSFNDGDPCTHDQSHSVDVFHLPVDDLPSYNRVETTRWNLEARIAQLQPTTSYSKPKDSTGWEHRKYDWGDSYYWWKDAEIPLSKEKEAMISELNTNLGELSIAFNQVYDTDFILLIYLNEKNELTIEKFDGYLDR